MLTSGMSANEYAAFNKVLAKRPKNDLDLESDLSKLKRLIMIHGLPSDDHARDHSLRPLIWKILLKIKDLRPHSYAHYIGQGPSALHDKIKNDAFRTLGGHQAFWARTDEETIIRVLDAFVAHAKDAGLHVRNCGAGRSGGHGQEMQQQAGGFGYVQGMNVLLAPFLYVMPTELEAFACFARVMEHSCPLYIMPSLEGVHTGLLLFDRCLECIDQRLFQHLISKDFRAEVYAFPSVLTLCACTPPLDEVLQLWDFLFAFGVHLNILCVIAQMLQNRDKLMASPSPMKILQRLPPLKAREILDISVSLIGDLSPRLYNLLARHPWDPTVLKEIEML